MPHKRLLNIQRCPHVLATEAHEHSLAEETYELREPTCCVLITSQEKCREHKKEEDKPQKRETNICKKGPPTLFCGRYLEV